MTTRAELLALAEQCENASGPDRVLDAAIMGLFTNSVESDNGEWWWGPHDAPPQRVPAFTASLDAALALVPEGMAWSVGQNVHHKHWLARVQIIDADGGPTSVGRCEGAATPALALCAAALRARAASAPDELEKEAAQDGN